MVDGKLLVSSFYIWWNNFWRLNSFVWRWWVLCFLSSLGTRPGSLPWLILLLSALLVPVMGHRISSLQNSANSSCLFASPGLLDKLDLLLKAETFRFKVSYCMVESNLPSLIDNMASGQADPSLVYSSYETISLPNIFRPNNANLWLMRLDF